MISQLEESVKKLSVGEEFVNWAEQYWRLKENYTEKEKEGSESCPYSVVKDIFIQKIDKIIKDRV